MRIPRSIGNYSQGLAVFAHVPLINLINEAT
jgi:hypothetical protein